MDLQTAKDLEQVKPAFRNVSPARSLSLLSIHNATRMPPKLAAIKSIHGGITVGATVGSTPKRW